jgi:hypothetical protein
MNQYTDGDLVHCIGVFSDPVSHELLRPTDVVVKVKDPSDVVTEPESYVEGDHTACDVDTTGKPGQWWYRFASPSVNQGAKENGFYVEESNFS